jgi:hypothetical protein
LIPSLTPRSPNPRSRVRLEYVRSKGGFPIRKSLDHSSFAAPQGLSQRTTSFIASQRQGIHRMLLRHLIALMIDARRLRNRPEQKDQPPALSDQRLMLAKHIPHRALAPAQDMFPLHDVKHPRLADWQSTNSIDSGRAVMAHEWAVWWSQTGSNRRPQACKASALPTELWPHEKPPDKTWWAWDDSNVRPHPYQGCALTT